MNRRGFLRALGIGAGAVVVAPYCTFAAPQPVPVRIPVRKIMSRIRITQEMLEDCQPGAFMLAARAEMSAALHDWEVKAFR